MPASSCWFLTSAGMWQFFPPTVLTWQYNGWTSELTFTIHVYYYIGFTFILHLIFTHIFHVYLSRTWRIEAVTCWTRFVNKILRYFLKCNFFFTLVQPCQEAGLLTTRRVSLSLRRLMADPSRHTGREQQAFEPELPHNAHSQGLTHRREPQTCLNPLHKQPPTCSELHQPAPLLLPRPSQPPDPPTRHWTPIC